MNVTLRQLRYFQAVVDHGTIAAAADNLHIAQSPLSRQIRQLEQDYGVTLFERQQQRLLLTDAGRHLYQRSQELLNLAAHTGEEMAALGQGSRGRVRVGTIATGIKRLTRAFEQLHPQWPDIRFCFQQGEPLYLERLVNERELDLAIVQRPVEISGLAAQPLAQLQFAALFADQIPANPPLTLARLAELPLALLRRNSRSGAFEQIMNCFQSQGLAPHIVAECSDVWILKRLVLSGMAVALLPVCTDQEPLFAHPRLKQIPIPELIHQPNALVLIRKAGVPLGPAAQKLHEQLLMAGPADQGHARDL